MSVFNDVVPDDEIWSLSTALAWISYRTKELVNASAPKGAFDPAEYSHREITEAAQLLWPHLKSGRITASTRIDDVKYVISASDWSQLKFSLSLGEEGQQIIATASSPYKGLPDISVPRADILVLWPSDKVLAHATPTMTSEDIRTAKRLYLGQVIDWILHRGQPKIFDNQYEFNAAHDEATRLMFEAIHDASAPVTGVHAATGKDEVISNGYWRRLAEQRDRRHEMSPEFCELDPSLGSLLGGVLVVKEKIHPDFNQVKLTRYEECHVPADFVRTHWPVEASVKPAGQSETSFTKRIVADYDAGKVHKREDVLDLWSGSRRGFDRAWAAATKDRPALSVPGRRSKKTQQ